MTATIDTETIDGVRVRLRRAGDPAAEPILLLHGFAGSLHWFDRLVPLLAPNHLVVCPDLRGHGETGGDTDLDAPAQGRTMARLLAGLGLENVAVLGHSFGADVALATAEQSARARAVIIVDQAPDYSYAHFAPGAGLFADPRLGSLLLRFAITPFVRLGLSSAVAPGFDLRTGFDDPDQSVRDFRAMSPHMFQVVLTDRRRRLAARPLDAQLGALGLPTLVLHGSRDGMYDPHRTAERYRSAGARVEIIEGAGHSPAVERPTEVAHAIDAFLRRRS